MNNSQFKIVSLISVGYLALTSVFLLWHRSWFSPDQFFVIALMAALILGRSKQFIKDWSPLLIIFLSYEYLRGLVPKLGLAVHIFPMIQFDQLFFKGIPTIQLQQALFHGQPLHWYDYLSVVLYMSHFIVPMMLGFIFWLTSRDHFKGYFLALLLLSYGAFITYIIFPAMPPWMASQQGFIPSVQKVMDQVFASLATPVNLPSVYKFLGANLVAAVPSLHAAYPWLTFLFVVDKLKKSGLLLFPYVGGVWFAIVYLGEHYVFDIVIGVIYASFAYLIVAKRSQTVSFLKAKLKIDRDPNL